MDYFDPARKRLGNGLPTLASGQAIPSPIIDPLERGGWEVLLMLVTYERRGGGTASWHRTQCPDDAALASFLASWRNDPEATIATCWPDFEMPLAKAEAVATASKPATASQLGLF